jgi:kynurenine formamidase
MKIHDVSVLLHGKMVIWPGDPKFSMSLASSIAKGAAVNLTWLEMGAHMDAPFPF